MLHEQIRSTLTLLAAAFIVQVLNSTAVLARTDPEICAALTTFAIETNKQLPKQMDQITSLIQIKVNCETSIVTYAKLIDISFKQLALGWQARKQQQHNELHCNKAGLSRAVGFTVRDTLQDPNLDSVEFVTRPVNCQ